MSQNRSSAVMAQRKEPPDSLDFFPTPPWATRALCERLASEGIVFETPPRATDIVGAKGFALFRDPDGVLLELIEL